MLSHGSCYLKFICVRKMGSLHEAEAGAGFAAPAEASRRTP
jgi:hypothetical protein